MEYESLVRDGKKKIQIKGKTEVRCFDRQMLTRSGQSKNVRITPINDFFEGTKHGKSVVSKNLEKEALAKIFVDLAKQNPDLATDIIASYIKEEKKLVESEQLSSGTLENHIKPIKVLLDSNES